MPASAPDIGPGLTWLLAAACGICAANLYYAQPLLGTLARSFGVGTGTAGLIVTSSQLGFAGGLALLVPLGDVVERRRLVVIMTSLTVVALIGVAAAPTMTVLIVVAFVLGIGSVTAQILVPLAASLASTDQQGRVVGRVMSGLLVGILLARTISGLIAGAGGWRTVYMAAAGLQLGLVVVLAFALPKETPRAGIAYQELLRSTVELLRREPVLRLRIALGALGFAAFSILWTTLAFLLHGAPYHYGDTVIGLFGLVGAAGALSASLAGRGVDRGRANTITPACVLGIAASFGLLYVGRTSLVALVAGILALDVGVQGLHITNQSVIYALRPEARSRINAGYMTGYFLGGAAGSAVAGVAYNDGGWGAACLAGVGVGVLATGFAVWSRTPLFAGASAGLPVSVGGPGKETS